MVEQVKKDIKKTMEYYEILWVMTVNVKSELNLMQQEIFNGEKWKELYDYEKQNQTTW